MSSVSITLLFPFVTGVKGFALLRKKYGKQGLTISRIYKKINAELKTLIDYKLELSLVENSFFENRYIVRMIDIAQCNNMKVSVVIRSIYPMQVHKLTVLRIFARDNPCRQSL